MGINFSVTTKTILVLLVSKKMGYLCLFYIKKGIPQKSISSGVKVTLEVSLDQKLRCTSFSHEVVMANSSFSELLLLMMLICVITPLLVQPI